ncbi:hypothetical protein BGX38DRAFT_475944 [Terfezia claveryi]|nr:hypothetical protein BGX38DRAFT_475944 [Terfezia claveryi]
MPRNLQEGYSCYNFSCRGINNIPLQVSMVGQQLPPSNGRGGHSNHGLLCERVIREGRWRDVDGNHSLPKNHLLRLPLRPGKNCLVHRSSRPTGHTVEARRVSHYIWSSNRTAVPARLSRFPISGSLSHCRSWLSEPHCIYINLSSLSRWIPIQRLVSRIQTLLPLVSPRRRTFLVHPRVLSRPNSLCSLAAIS